jgi:hypothetical protein
LTALLFMGSALFLFGVGVAVGGSGGRWVVCLVHLCGFDQVLLRGFMACLAQTGHFVPGTIMGFCARHNKAVPCLAPSIQQILHKKEAA